MPRGPFHRGAAGSNRSLLPQRGNITRDRRDRPELLAPAAILRVLHQSDHIQPGALDPQRQLRADRHCDVLASDRRRKSPRASVQSHLHASTPANAVLAIAKPLPDGIGQRVQMSDRGARLTLADSALPTANLSLISEISNPCPDPDSSRRQVAVGMLTFAGSGRLSVKQVYSNY